jgi:hypothetical protein
MTSYCIFTKYFISFNELYLVMTHYDWLRLVLTGPGLVLVLVFPKKAKNRTGPDFRTLTAVYALSPPHSHLSWNEVVEYAFLADFDLLHDTHQDTHERPWVMPACHLAMDQHFKLEQAHEEIQQLNVEIPWVITYICDEDAFLRKEDEIRLHNTTLAHQVLLHQQEHSHFNTQHMEHFGKLAHTPGFTGTIWPGVSLEFATRGPAELRAGGDQEMEVDDNGAETDEEDSGESDEEEALAAQLYHVPDILRLNFSQLYISHCFWAVPTHYYGILYIYIKY